MNYTGIIYLLMFKKIIEFFETASVRINKQIEYVKQNPEEAKQEIAKVLSK